MVAKRITPLLLAASVLVCGFTGGFISKQPAYGVTRVDELSDVCETNWAYNALKDLVEKYNVVEGYPNKTFRGNKAPTRYEMASALDATIKTMGKQIARLGAEKANKEDLATVARLQQEFATELTALRARSDALEARAVKVEAKNDEQDNRLAVLEKMKIYGDVNFGGYADIAGNPDTAFSDAISAVGRTRVNVDYTAVEDKGGAVVGPGTIHTRLVAAFGRVAPLEADSTIARNRYSGASAIASDSSLFNEGIRPNDIINLGNGTALTGAGLATVGGANLRANAYFDSAYYSQVLRASLPYLPKDKSWNTTFTTSAGLIPWRDVYFHNPYQGNENTQFQNTALINNPAILTNMNVPRIAEEINQGLGRWVNLKGKVDVSAMDIADAMNGIGLTTEASLGYNLGFLNDIIGTQNIFNLSGNVFGGYYMVKSSGGLTNNLTNVATTAVTPAGGGAAIPANGGPGDMAQGFYVGGNQEIYKGIGGFGSFALNDTGPTSSLLSALQTGTGTNIIYNNSTINGFSLIYGIRQAFTAGLELPIRALPKFITFGKRQRDVMGFGWARIYPQSSGGSPANGNAAVAGVPANIAARNPEDVLEGYYKLQVNDGFALIPSLQVIIDRMGSTPNNADIVIGLRSSFYF